MGITETSISQNMMEEPLLRCRDYQKALRKAGFRKEKKLDRYDICGLPDPTPYEAVKKIFQQNQMMGNDRSAHHDNSPNRACQLI